MNTGSEMLLERLRAATADEYVIEGELGFGGMAAVFLARDIALDRYVAIKVMRPDLVGVERIQERFVSEARTAARLDHPGIVSVYAVKQRAGLLFIVMKYVEGRTLEGILQASNVLDPSTAATIAGTVAEALHFAHGTGIVHRDVKPSNILIDTRGRAVVTDFGIARVMAAESITVAGSVLGTPSYMSPEQCRGLPATAASDQYALGVTLYEMLTGRVPFTGSLFELLDAHREQAPPSMRQFVDGVDAVMEETVMRMLAKNPQDRWGSLGEVAQRLSQTSVWTSPLLTSGADFASPIVTSTPPATPVVTSIPAPQPEHTPVVVEPPRASRRALIGGVATLVVALVVAAVLWMQRGSSVVAADPRPDSLARANTPATPLSPSPPVSDSTLTAAPRSQAGDSPQSPPVSAPREPMVTAPATTSSATPSLGTPAVDAAKDTQSPPAREQARPTTPLAPRTKADSSRTAAVRPESLRVECARLLERASLGEKLTDADRDVLRRYCNR